MSRRIDVFNGDADGLLALHQFRLAFPEKTLKVTGVKRDIELLKKIENAEGDEISVFDISMLSNIKALEKCLQKDCRVVWFDHHRSGDIPASKNLKTHIDLSPSTCTSLIVEDFIGKGDNPWATAAAYGDNLYDVADRRAENFTEEQRLVLKKVGETINYNGYGEKLEDLMVDPEKLYEDVSTYSDPWEYASSSALFAQVRRQFELDDLELKESEILHQSKAGNCVLLPATEASTRMSGIFSNEMARTERELAHATFTKLSNGNYRVSIRAPFERLKGADELASAFPGGGGRAGAGGVNELDKHSCADFFKEFDRIFGS